MPRLHAFGLALALLVSSPGLAAETDNEFDLGFARPGMALDDLRQVAWPDGARIVCGADQPAPGPLAPHGQALLSVPARMADLRVDRCGLFKADQNGVWAPATVPLDDLSAELWVTTLDRGGKGEQVSQIDLKLARANFAATVAALSQRFGPPDRSTPTLAHWLGATREAVADRDRTGRVSVQIVDLSLQDLMRARLRAHPTTRAH